MRTWIRWHLLRHLDDLRDGTKARALLHLALSLLGDPAERRLGQQEAEIERLRCQLETERADLDKARLSLAQALDGLNPATGRYDAYLVEKRKRKEAERQRDVAQQDAADTLATARQQIDLMASARDTALQEVARLRALLARLTPRTYREGDPVPEGPVLWWRGHDRGWRLLRPDLLVPGDRWLPLPPPPDEDKR